MSKTASISIESPSEGGKLPKLIPETLEVSRTSILDAAELCFARDGFHRSSVQNICSAAGISAGAFYVHFESKEQLIAGICERDRRQFAERFEAFAAAESPLDALGRLAETYLFEDAQHKRQLFVEIGAEATRNPEVKALFTSVDRFVEDSFTTFIEYLIQTGRASPTVEPRMAAKLILVIGDGLFWRTAVTTDTDIQDELSAAMATIGQILGMDLNSGHLLQNNKAIQRKQAI
ncbi:MAG: TetR/AcrR family transcriptional regulator [Pseudomonadota bacterium]